MSKILETKVRNMKAIAGEKIMNFSGCSAIITGKNQSGKSTMLAMLPDRLRGEKPELILNFEETEGQAVLTLTTGEKFIWDVVKKANKKGELEIKEKLTFITKDNISTAVTKEIAAKFFPTKFDIDEFLESQPQEQSKMIAKLLGIDFTDIDARYKKAFDERTELKKVWEADKLVLAKFNPIPEKCEVVEIEVLKQKKQEISAKLNEQYLANKKINDDARKKYETEKQSEIDKIREVNKAESDKIAEFNTQQIIKNDAIISLSGKIEAVKRTAIQYEISDLIDFSKATEKLNSLPKPEKTKIYNNLPEVSTLQEPTYITELPDDTELKSIDKQIEDSVAINQKAQNYINFIAAQKAVKDSYDAAILKDAEVKGIKAEKDELLKKAALPEGFELTDDGLMVDGLPLNKKQHSASKVVISGLKLAAMKIGEVRSLHFDASTLDMENLELIEKWANENDLQLLIEQPSRDKDNELKYVLIEEIK